LNKDLEKGEGGIGWRGGHKLYEVSGWTWNRKRRRKEEARRGTDKVFSVKKKREKQAHHPKLSRDA